MITIESLKERPLSYSSLKEFSKSPRHYVSYLNKRTEATPAMMYGSMVHCLLLTPELFDKQFAVMGAVDRRTKDGKIAYEEFVKSAEGKDVVTEQDYREVKQLTDYLMTFPYIEKVIKDCYDKEFHWESDNKGLPIHGYFDGVAKDYVLEIKTTQDANPKTIINDFYNRMYHLQAGMYNYATGKPIKYLIIETKAPNCFYLADADSMYVDFGKHKMNSLLKSFKECMDNNTWDMSYDFHTGGDINISLPSWVKNLSPESLGI